MSKAARGPQVAIAREIERVRGGSGVADASRDRDGFGAELVPRPHVPVVAPRPGKPREESHPQRAVSSGEGSERLLQQGDDLRVGAGAHPHEPSAVADRGACELLHAARLPREIGGLEEGRLRDVGVAAATLGIPQGQEQLGPLGVIGRSRQRVEGHLEETSALLVRELLHRALACEPRVGHRTIDGADREAGTAMPRELGETLTEIASTEHLERAAGLVMQPAASQRRDLLVQGFGHDRVPEAQMACSPGAVHDDRRSRGFVERGRDVHAVAGERGEHIEREVAPEHRRELEHAVTLVRQLAEATQHRLADITRDEQPIRLSRLVETPLGREQPCGLADIQRVAVGELADPRSQPQRGVGAGRRSDDLRDAHLVETAEPQTRRAALTYQLREHLREPFAGRLGVAVGGDDEEPHRIQMPSEELQQQQRRRVRDMHVVEHRDHRRLDRAEPAEPHNRVVEAEASGVGGEPRIRHTVGE